MPIVTLAAAFAIAAAVQREAAAAGEPSVSPSTLVTFAYQENGVPGRPALNAYAIHDNTSGRSEYPETYEDAVSRASHLIYRLHHSVDLGVMQVNSANLGRVGMSVADAFRVKYSMRAGSRILADAWSQCGGDNAKTPTAKWSAMNCAASVYNSGSAHGAPKYAARIWRTAAQVVPDIGKLAADFTPAAPGTNTGARPTTNTTGDVVVTPTEPATTAGSGSPPSCRAQSWDVWGMEECSRKQRGAAPVESNQAPKEPEYP